MSPSLFAYLPPHLANALQSDPQRSPLDITLCGEAAEHARQALMLAEQQHDLRLMALAARLYGNILHSAADYDQALRYLELAHAHFTELDDRNELMLTLGDIIGSYTFARRCYEASLAQIGEPLRPRALGWILGNLAKVLNEQGQTEVFEHLQQLGTAICRRFDVLYHLAQSLAYQAKYYLGRQSFHEAMVANSEAIELARNRQIRDIVFETEIRAIYLAVLLEQLPASSAIEQLDQLRVQWAEPQQQAWLNFTVWQIDPQQEEARRIAAAQYASLFAAAPRQEYRKRYQELTGEQLPDPPPLPPPSIVDETVFDLPCFLKRVEALLEQ